jgi:glucose dehydrogenase|tara:strand:- start:1401 stop:1661 length:261 start_codon:yes stop_codon:yes gene_type:complete
MPNRIIPWTVEGFFVSLLFSASALANNTDWPSHGQDYKEQRYSQLAAINEENVSQLGLAWSFDTDFNRGLESTPIIVDGAMYATGS